MPQPPAPQPWFDSLPIVTANELTDGYYIFVGTAEGSTTSIENPILLVDGNACGVSSETNSAVKIWRYDIGNEELISDGHNSSGLAANLRTQIGWEGENMNVTNNIQLTREMVLGKIFPIG